MFGDGYEMPNQPSILRWHGDVFVGVIGVEDLPCQMDQIEEGGGEQQGKHQHVPTEVEIRGAGVSYSAEWWG